MTWGEIKTGQPFKLKHIYELQACKFAGVPICGLLARIFAGVDLKLIWKSVDPCIMDRFSYHSNTGNFQQFVQANIKENIINDPLWGASSGDRWVIRNE